METVDLSKLAKYFSDEDAARTLLEEWRWGKDCKDAACPHCGVMDVYRLNRQAGSSTRKGVWKCRACRKQFTVTVGTVFEASHVALSKWLLAIHLMSASKKGMSAHQLHRMLGVSYRAAWFMMHRLRYAMSVEPMASQLSGVVEVDETYVGGTRKGRYGRPAAGDAQKTAVVALVERNGRARAFPVERVSGATMREIIGTHIDQTKTRLMTDEAQHFSGYKAGKMPHETVNHAKGEYVRGDVTTNAVEGFFSLFKRGIIGTFHHVSKGHMDKYADEFAFRYSHRHVNDGERAVRIVHGAEGKRLTYKQPAGAGA